ncbi:leucine-rich repeat-containing protein 19 isoform X2 [Fundulus heteroclitus]|uniref:leucine-rich repeat-containing protein 19 isoform X2 n=1 Tax=Fundulus heteroclitus TaxID=8078 RepID=UPI00165B0AA5|nr:leucine-rich repeat-containing protein 19 isoform X2 [Fundulus heteroclitus]
MISSLGLGFLSLQSEMMDGCWTFLLLLGLSAVVTGQPRQDVETDASGVRNLTGRLLQVIPPNHNSSNVSTLLIKGNQITLNETDRQALATYPTLVELHLGGNRVTAVPARCFSGLSRLRVLSLARNRISSLNPEALSGLDALEELDLSNNNLTELPAKMTELKTLKILRLEENPWNCSCPLLNAIGSLKEAHVIIGTTASCSSPAERQGRKLLDSINLCSTSSPGQNPPPTPVTSQQTKGISNMPATAATSPNCTISKDQKPAPGNTWKFTACVAALALTTCMLILAAIKGPSWYKRIHNYRHRRLHHDDDDEEPQTVSAVFRETRGQHTFMFEELSHQVEEGDEEEDGYFEDPYIKKAEDADAEIVGGTEAH